MNILPPSRSPHQQRHKKEPFPPTAPNTFKQKNNSSRNKKDQKKHLVNQENLLGKKNKPLVNTMNVSLC